LKQRIVFRSDGDSEIGLGHVVRSLALSKILRDHFNCIFATRFVSDFLFNEISESCADLIKLSENCDDHFQEFLQLLRKTDIVVLDNYFFNTDYQIAIKNLGCTLVCIDDMSDKHYVSDVIINHSPGKSDGDFSRESYTRLCLGLDFALLRREFFSAIVRRVRKSPRRALVCLGGADKFDITSKIVSLLCQHRGVQIIDIIIGAAYEHSVKLNKVIAGSDKRINLYSNLSAQEMSFRMQVCDFGVLPASSVCLEALAVGLPFILGYTVENQISFYNVLISDFNVRGIGNFASLKRLPSIQIENLPQILLKDSRENLISVFERL